MSHPEDQTRQDMEDVLKARVVPALRAAGFKGSFPHFHREEEDGSVDLVTVQGFSAGGSFFVEIGYADPTRGKVARVMAGAAPGRLRVSGVRDRTRLGATDAEDRWFCYGRTTYGDLRGTPRPAHVIAEEVTALLAQEGEAWWASSRAADR